VFTAAITGAIAAILSLFGIKPGPYLVGVAIVVKAIIVGVGLLIGLRMSKRRKQAPAAPAPPLPEPPK
jgi:hypothetical protein